MKKDVGERMTMVVVLGKGRKRKTEADRGWIRLVLSERELQQGRPTGLNGARRLIRNIDPT